jgi:DNA-binding beta-propeller fold protein YncE
MRPDLGRLSFVAVVGLFAVSGVVAVPPLASAEGTGIAPASATRPHHCVPRGADHLGYSPNINEHYISIIDERSHVVVGRIDGFRYPWSAQVSADGSTLYVDEAPLTEPGSVTVVDLCTRQITKKIPTGFLPFSSMGRDGRLIVTEILGGKVDVIDSKTATVIASVNPHEAVPIAAVAEGNTLWVSYVSGDVNTIDLVTGKESAPFKVGAVPAVLALTPDGSTLVSANLGGDVAFVDTKSRAIRTVSIGDGTYPSTVAVTPDGNDAWVGYASGEVAVIDVHSGVIRKIHHHTGLQLAVSFSTDGRRAYMAGTPDGTIVPQYGLLGLVPILFDFWTWGGVVRVYDTTSFDQVGEIRTGTGAASTVAIPLPPPGLSAAHPSPGYPST